MQHRLDNPVPDDSGASVVHVLLPCHPVQGLYRNHSQDVKRSPTYIHVLWIADNPVPDDSEVT